MKISPSTFFALYCVVVGATASAQVPSTVPPLPPGPLIQKRAPDCSKWVISTVSAPANHANSATASNGSAGATNDADNKAKKVSLEVTMTKTGQIMLREVRTPDGKVVPTWCVRDLQITLLGGTSIVQARMRNADPTVPTANYEDYSDSDFLGFDWINISNYAGMKEVAGRKCIVFQDTIKNGAGLPISMSACVDLETRLPVELTIGGGTRSYTFMEPPASELVLPPTVVQLLKNRQRQLDSATPRSQMQ